MLEIFRLADLRTEQTNFKWSSVLPNIYALYLCRHCGHLSLVTYDVHIWLNWYKLMSTLNKVNIEIRTFVDINLLLLPYIQLTLY